MHSRMSKSHAASVARLLRTKATSQMTAEELAKVWAAQRGFYSQEGGWVYDPSGEPVKQGWYAFAHYLAFLGHIKVGRGINWAKSQHLPEVDGIDPRKVV
jgi:hypothetical protein